MVLSLCWSSPTLA